MEKDEVKTRVSNLIQEAMDSLGLNAIGLSKKLGLRQSQELSRWLKGETVPSSTVLFKLAEIQGKEVLFVNSESDEERQSVPA